MAVTAGMYSAQCCCHGRDCQGGVAFPGGNLLWACPVDKGTCAGVGGSQLASIDLCHLLTCQWTWEYCTVVPCVLASACFLNLFHVTLPSMQEGKGPEIEILSALSTFFSQVVLEADLQQTPYSSYAPSATSEWSSLIALNLTFQQVDTQMMTNFLHTGVNQFQILVFNCVQLDTAVILQLTQSECPRLRSLALSYTGLGSMAVSYLAQGKWPLLWKVSLEGNEDTVLDELFKGDWPLIEKLKLTVRSLRGKAITRWLGLSSNGVQEALNLPT